MLLGSASLCLGGKASKDIIRSGEEYAFCEMGFSVDAGEAVVLEKEDIYPEDGKIYLSRRISGGKSISKINGETVPVSVLRKIAPLLINVHGQHDNAALLVKQNHKKLLDENMGKEGKDALDAYREAFKYYDRTLKELEEGSQDKESRKREISFLEFEVNEIEKAKLKKGEDTELEEAFRLMSMSQEIKESLAGAYRYLDETSDIYGRAFRDIEDAKKKDDSIQDIYDEMQEADDLLSTLMRSISGKMDELEYSEEELRTTEMRLNEINTLKGKYGRSMEDIFAALDEKKSRLEKLYSFEEWKNTLENEVKEAKKDAMEKAKKLSSERKKAAQKLSKKISANMAELNFARSDFEIRVEDGGQMSPDGTDDVSIYLSTNVGEEPRPIEKCASGGELSRIMLAVKCSVKSSDASSMIFDEIDTGISGKTAQKVAEKLLGLSLESQVICITHLPQIAAKANRHFLIEKKVENGETVSDIKPLDEEGMIDELSRMIGGEDVTEAVRMSAREMRG